MNENPLLHLRQVVRDKWGDLAAHVSLFRWTDSAWIMQEGVSVAASGPGFEHLINCLILRAREARSITAMAPRSLVWFWDPKVTATEKLAAGFDNIRANPRFKAAHFRIDALLDLTHQGAQEHSDTKILDLESVTSRERHSLLANFDAALLELFGGDAGAHPRLNAALSGLGAGHKASVTGLADASGLWGLAYRLESYYSWNVSGVLASVFLCVKPGTTPEQITSGLKALTSMGFAFGTNDVTIVTDKDILMNATLSRLFDSGREFRLMIMDLKAAPVRW